MAFPMFAQVPKSPKKHQGMPDLPMAAQESSDAQFWDSNTERKAAGMMLDDA